MPPIRIKKPQKYVQIFDYAKHLLGESYLEIKETPSETPGTDAAYLKTKGSVSRPSVATVN